MEQLVIFIIPIFTTLMVVEFTYGLLKKKNTYSLSDTFSNLMQGLISRLSQFVNHFFHIGIYSIVYHLVWQDYQNTFWFSWQGIALGLVIFDFCDYWLHRAEHEIAIFWASHVVHHQSKHYNLSVALRQVSTEPILGFVFYLPLALIGLPPQQLLLTVLVVLFYQFWIHTEHIPKLGWFDALFNSPANHRVHHATNPQYIDKNYGGFLMVWDRMFGTYEPEVEACVYGTKKPFESVDPVWSILSEYVSIYQSVKQSTGCINKFRALFMPPGWTDLQREPNEVTRLASSTTKGVICENTGTLGNRKVKACLAQFFTIALLTILFLSTEEEIAYLVALPIIASLVLMCWALGALIVGRLNYWQLLLIDSISAVAIYVNLSPLIS